MNSSQKNIILIAVIGLFLFLLVNMFEGSDTSTSQPVMPFSDFLARVDEGKVSDVTMKGSFVTGHLSEGGTAFSTYLPDNTNIVDRLETKGVKIQAQPETAGEITFWGVLLSSWPMLLMIAVYIFFMRQMNGASGKAMSFGRSKARLLTEKTGKVTFEDVAGVEEAKQELEEVVEFLRDPQKFLRLGGKIPKGVLLVGPPGTGKTLIARAVAGEANVPFFTISGSDFVEMFVGVGASRVRDMFEQGKKNAPCIIFIDEIDAVGRHRGAGLGGGNDEREQTLNQLLVEMDGFEANEGVILIAATNRPDVLDPALLRPGRFDRQVVVPNPDIMGRERILKVHMRKVALAPNVDAHVIARGTPGFSGADLANLVNEAALLAARKNKAHVEMDDFEAAKDKVMMGAERRSMAMTDKERELTAYHEAGHALVGIHVPGNDPLHKVTIIPRGRALGVTMNLPERDKLSQTKSEIEARIAMTFGGRVAEELVYGKENITTGASSDIQQATAMARRMVTAFGMSDKLGRVRYQANEQEVFLGHSVAQTQNISEETARIIDEEIRRIIEQGEGKAREILTVHMGELKTIAEALLEYETLSGDEVQALLRGESINRKEPTARPPSADKPASSRKGSVPDVVGTPASGGSGSSIVV
ncbi:MAG: ATP-dependent metallopeptidase FtsH/Yme1/Tma family protein [Proteobacteria bacterium]|nr:ATP-dependent metallopeptidase FtsH/Yme1/Tma family protein [Pseudomonadota bacterium]